jgi:integrase
MRAKRDYAMLAMLFGCGFRRSELVGLELDDIQSLCVSPGLSGRVLRRPLLPGVPSSSKGLPQSESIRIPFSPDAMLSLVHVEDVARMLFTLTKATKMDSFVYNTPAEIWEVKQLKELVEKLRGVRVELVPEGARGGPMCEGSRFAREFGFQLRELHDHLSGCTKIDRESQA